MILQDVKVGWVNEINIRVPYADTDQMGMVYYANYLVYFERGRTEWLRERGLSYKDLESKGIYLPVIEAHCKYVSPARYDDLITVRTILSEISFASIIFNYEVTAGEKALVKGSTKHPFVNKDLRPVKIPEEIKVVLEKR
ncbi:MAG: acyl-CoA thioesterase [Elusimicrobia bacterium]|nr:acyl-CoA thioesterase [Candidatus Liberimonas magnetica]